MSNHNDKQKSKDLIKGIAIYGIGSMGSKILSFLLVPLYTYYIATGDMGVYDLLHTTIGLLTPVITMQISDAAFRWMIREPKEKRVLYKGYASGSMYQLLHCWYFDLGELAISLPFHIKPILSFL